MKREKKLLLLCGTLVVVGAAALGATKLVPDESTEIEDTSVSIFQLDADTLTQLSWSYNGETVSLDKSEGNWTYTDDAACPINSSYPEAMVSALSDVQSAKTIEDVEDLSEYGLDDPQCTITVTANGTETQLLIGDETSLGGQLYFSTGDGNVYLVDSSLLNSFSYGLYNIIQAESIPSMNDISSLTVESTTQTLELVYLENSGLAYSDDFVWFLKDGADYLPLGASETESFVSQVTGLSWSSCINYHASEDELASYGLDHPAATVTVNYTETVTTETNETDEDGNPVTETHQEDRSFVLELGDYTGESCYARIADSSMVYLIDASIMDSLLHFGYDDLRSANILSMDWDYLTGFDVTLDGQTYSFTADHQVVTDEEGSSYTEVTYLLDGQELDGDAVESLLSQLNSLEAAGSASSQSQGLDEEISFVFYQDKSKWPQVALTLREYDSATSLAFLDGELRLVDQSSVSSLIDAVTALVEETNGG